MLEVVASAAARREPDGPTPRSDFDDGNGSEGHQKLLQRTLRSSGLATRFAELPHRAQLPDSFVE